MIGNKYKYMLIDSSYLITRNISVLHKNYVGSGQEYTYGDVIKMFIWSINKLYRDYKITADKVVLLWDLWGKDGYHRSNMLKGEYKDDRVYITEEDVAKETDPEEKKKKEIEAYKNSTKQRAKYTIINELGKYGFTSFSSKSWEADDIAMIWSNLLHSVHEKDGLRSVIVSRDSDWKFWTSPYVDNFRLKVGNNPEKLVTYDDVMREDFPQSFLGKLSLYDYKSMYDSIEGSHNNMRRTRIDNVDTNFLIYKILQGDKDVVKYFEDYDRYKLQLKTFRLNEFEGFDKVNNMFYYIDKSGKIGSVDEFRKFADENGIGISDSYYQKFINNLDPVLYES